MKNVILVCDVVWSIVPLLLRMLVIETTVNLSGDFGESRWCCGGLLWVLIMTESTFKTSTNIT